jgi:thiamine transport system ATP-binding protein
MLQCLRLSVQFEDVVALDAVNLTVPDGEVAAIMGPSGCGKTSLLRVIAGLQVPDIGSVSWDGRNLRGVLPHARGFGFMFQDYALFPHLSVQDNVEFGLRMKGMDVRGRRRRALEMLDLVDLTAHSDRAIHELSGGEQQRVALARALAPAPRLILLDEPVGALDRTLRERLITEMHDIFGDLGVTAVYVTHDRDEAFAIADTVGVMSDGRLLRKGSPEELWRDPQREFVAQMLGFNAIVDAKVYRGWADLGWTKVASKLDSGEHRLAIPPHAIRVAGDGPVIGRVLKSTYRSGRYDLDIKVDGTLVSATSTHRYYPDDPIAFHVEASELLEIHD